MYRNVVQCTPHGLNTLASASLVLAKVKDDIAHYRTFWDSFESAVHNEPCVDEDRRV